MSQLAVLCISRHLAVAAPEVEYKLTMTFLHADTDMTDSTQYYEVSTELFWARGID